MSGTLNGPFFLVHCLPYSVSWLSLLVSGGSSSGSRGAPAPLDPKTPWSLPLAPPSFWRRKDEEEGEEEERKEEISPPLRISGFITVFDIYLLETLA